MLSLEESTERLAPLCRQVEKKVTLPPALGDMCLPVTLLPNFDDQPGAQESSLIRHDWAAYRPSQKRIIINGSAFFGLPESVALATLAHEVGHAVYQRAKSLSYDLGYGDLHEEILADALACEWGFSEEVCQTRREAYGEEYCTLLRSRDPKSKFVVRAEMWLQQYMLRKTLDQLGWKY